MKERVDGLGVCSHFVASDLARADRSRLVLYKDRHAFEREVAFFRISGVDGNGPGATALTVIRFGPSSRASTRVRWWMPALLAE